MSGEYSDIEDLNRATVYITGCAHDPADCRRKQEIS